MNLLYIIPTFYLDKNIYKQYFFCFMFLHYRFRIFLNKAKPFVWKAEIQREIKRKEYNDKQRKG